MITLFSVIIGVAGVASATHCDAPVCTELETSPWPCAAVHAWVQYGPAVAEIPHFRGDERAYVGVVVVPPGAGVGFDSDHDNAGVRVGCRPPEWGNPSDWVVSLLP